MIDPFDDEGLKRMKAEQEFGMRFMPSVTSTIAYKQARHCLSGKGGPVPYTEAERAYIDAQRLLKAREVLLGSILDRFGGRGL